ncbi:hypothetical protein [Novipirellula aureliae]|uniref:hypothetical protein n=1 Tax=Novipirellula aureliae TaxID=2527966 RepID=UPI0011B74351|nr:hypothetical protein [Novipirellula aureliae]
MNVIIERHVTRCEPLPYSVLNLRRVPVSVYEETVEASEEEAAGDAKGCGEAGCKGKLKKQN